MGSQRVQTTRHAVLTALVVTSLVLAACVQPLSSGTAPSAPAGPKPSLAGSPTLALPRQFVSLHMLNEQIGWAASNDSILRTADGGVHWRNVTPGLVAGGVGQAYFFLDAQRAWLAWPVMQGSSPTDAVEVVWTADGGINWQSSRPIHLRWIGDPYYLTFLDAAHGWLLTSNGPAAGSAAVDVFATTNGGSSWTETSYGDYQGSTRGALTFGCDKAGFAFMSSLTGWATGACNGPSAFFMVTHDGGRTWSAELIANPENQLGESEGLSVPTIFPSRGAGVMAADPLFANQYGTLVYSTTDGGKNWYPQELPSLTALDGIEIFSALDMDHWWIFGRDGVMVERTTDGGRHWQQNRTNLPPVDGLTLDFVSAQVGYAAGTFGGHYAGLPLGLYKTVDAGQTWQVIPTTDLPR